METPDQKNYWNQLHQERKLSEYSHRLTSFAQKVAQLLPPQACLLELGCGEGNDSLYFANEGHLVTATDFAQSAITSNQQRYPDQPNLSFQVVDISQNLPFSGEMFDGVYSRLSLHYFTNETTQKALGEVNRVLKRGGRVFFMCKSINDPLYGLGERIEEDMFVYNGHVRHFFSHEYIRKVLRVGWRIECLENGQEDLYGHRSSFIQTIAQKI